MKKIYALLTVIVFAVAAFVALQVRGASAAEKPEPQARGAKFLSRGADRIPDQYIVVLDESATGPLGRFSFAAQAAEALRGAYGGEILHVYDHVLNGYAVRMPEAAARRLSEDPRVLYVEEDGEMSIDATQTNATWGLDRIDQRDRPLNGTYNYNWTGSGVRAYIIDTGIRPTHTQFGGRAAVAFDATGGNGLDCNGHGTHVAGTIGGSVHGVAKSVQLRGVRVFGCGSTTSTSTIISGVNWVAANHVKPAVANMSLGGGISSSLDTAVNNLINAGVTVAVAAGNNNGADACNTSPARVANAITVGSSTSTDARSSFSNIGPCLDIFAPGSSITSTWSTSDTATNTISGTSMASPHVAGVAALYLQANPGASPATVRNAIVSNSTTNRLTSIGTGSPNRLLYSFFF
jgi:subtilisin family serine protease